MNIQRVTIISVVIFIAIYLGLLLIGLFAAIKWGESAALYFSYFKDLLTISLIMASLIIVVSIGILIAQIAKLVNLIHTQIQPLTAHSRKTLSTITATSKFIQNHAIQPIIQASSFLAGLMAFTKELLQLIKLIQQKPIANNDDLKPQEDQKPVPTPPAHL